MQSTIAQTNPLIVDRRTTTTSPAVFLASLTGFFFSFRVFIILLSVRLFGMEAQTGVAISLLLNFLLLGVVAFESAGPRHQPLGPLLRMPNVRWVLLFFAFTGCSLTWSSTASLPAATAFWLAMAADTVMVLLLLRSAPAHAVAASLAKGFLWGALSIAFIAWIMPSQSDLRLGDEELLGPNQIGWVCGFGFFLAQYLLRRKEGKWGIAAAILAITLLRSLSKTTIIAFLISEGFLLLRDGSISRKKKILLALAALGTVGLFWGLLESYYDVYRSAGNQAETLTGRLGIWTYILAEALEKPWLGHGFHSVWKVIPPFGDFEARHAHNELLQQFYAYGAAGICMMAGLYGSFYWQLKKLPHSPLKTFLLAMLLFVLIRGLTDTEPFDLSLPMWIITLFSALVLEAIQDQPDISPLQQ